MHTHTHIYIHLYLYLYLYIIYIYLSIYLSLYMWGEPTHLLFLRVNPNHFLLLGLALSWGGGER